MTDTHKHTHAKGNGTLVLRGGIYHPRWMLNGKVYSRSTKTGSKREAEAKLREFTDAFRLMWETPAANPDARHTANLWKSIRRRFFSSHPLETA